MEIILNEFKKVLKSPVLTILIVLFLIYNGFIIYSNSYIREDLKLANDFIEQFGYEVNDEMIDNVSKAYDSKMTELNKITKDKFNKEFSSIDEFLESQEYEGVLYNGEGYSDKEIDLLNDLSIMNLYKNAAIGNIKAYEGLDIMEMAEGSIYDYNLSGKAADKVREIYSKLVPRFEELKANNEHKNIYFVGDLYKTHSLLYRNIMVKVLFEIIIFILLLVSLLINYERDNKTIDLVCTTRRGRNLIKDKLLVCLVAAIIGTVVILGVTLFMYFIVFDYSKVMSVPISSALNWELTPVISWFNISVGQYLALSIVVVFILAIIFTLISFVICSILKSSYKTFFVFFILFGLVFMIQKFISNSSGILIASHYNVVIMTLNPHMWFREAGPFMTDKYYEVLTLAVNGVLAVMISIWRIKRFKKENIA
ncbi:ABC-type transport system involved in multi-copper enzyme maturation%2C permease component [uncultured Clostridium sp.]|uniref:ABC transporter permease subunit n=1 Tax=uncultured Clostridium sp. TaxID=59620 RepID=UPI0008224A3D|nr:ABC transporter permease subunit [uncultured Clostridium sp.]SCJ93264.1 ABC-type transport system involved in multi-copper enzyme maturation%2C permease component [uncultured Clostridium sp.]